jgi:hypothetical protein
MITLKIRVRDQLKIIKGSEGERRRHTSKESVAHLRADKDFHSADLAREKRTTTKVPFNKYNLFSELEFYLTTRKSLGNNLSSAGIRKSTKTISS